MDNSTIYQEISARTGGDIYIGVVGPVRSGKSTFIKKFMELLVLPNMESAAARACIFRLHPATCTEKSCHSAGKNLPRYRISLPVITNIGKM